MKSTAAGFTFIETLLVVGISAFVLSAIFGVVWNIIGVSLSEERFQAAQLELDRAEARMSFLIRNADSLESLSATSIVLGVPGSSDTVTISLDNGTIMVEQAGNRVALTGDSVFITATNFSLASLSGSPAQFVSSVLEGRTRGISLALPVSLRGGAEIRSLLEP